MINDLKKIYWVPELWDYPDIVGTPSVGPIYFHDGILFFNVEFYDDPVFNIEFCEDYLFNIELEALPTFDISFYQDVTFDVYFNGDMTFEIEFAERRSI